MDPSLLNYAAPALIPPFATNLSLIQSVFFGSVGIKPFPDCSQDPLRNLTICNTSASTFERASSLISQFTREEKFNYTSFYLPGVGRLGVPPYTIGNEALHGLATSPGVDFATNGSYDFATSFPQPILTAAAFDDDLVLEVATAISIEARAFGNVGRAGLDFWAPNINPFRNPLWGRGQETPGEDAFRVSGYAEAFVRGLEGPSNSTFKRGIATCKHFAAYDTEDYKNVTRWIWDAKVSTQDLAEYYTRPWQACVRDAKAGSVMCSYNEINGVPSCLNPYLLQTILRDHWNWEAPDHYITSDGFSLDVAFDSHNYTATPEQTAADALKAGVDTDDGVFLLQYLPTALSQGLIEEADLDRALTRVFGALIKLGYYDPPSSQPYRQLNFADVNTPATQNLARYAATSGITLLKNQNNTLPLSTNNKTLSIALVGDWANATTQMLGNYAGISPYIHSPLYGLQTIPNVNVNLVPSILDATRAFAAAENSDVILYIGGIDNSAEAEGLDRTILTWNTTQSTLISQLSQLGKPLIIAQTGGGQLDSSIFLSNPNISAMLWIGYPGQDGGVALADILFGNVAPAGRLPVSMYPASYVDVPATDMSLRPNETDGNPGRTYKWYNGSVLEFGYGLHYTNFSANASVTWPANMDAGEVVRMANSSGGYADLYEVGKLVVDVRNEGGVVSDYSVLAFVNGAYGAVPRPRRELMAYGRARQIKCGEVRRVELGVRLGSLTKWDEGGRRVLYPGTYRVVVDMEPGLAEVEIEITGSETVVEQFPVA